MGGVAVAKKTEAAPAPAVAPPPVEDTLVDPTVAAASAAVASATVSGDGKGKGKDKPKPKPFDPYNAPPEVKAALLRLSNTTDAKAQKPIIAELKKAGVPMDLIHGITQGDTGIIDKAKLIAKGPGIHQTTLGEDGSVEKEFHLDQKHIEWDGQDQRFDADWNDQKATYEHKKSNTVVEAGAAKGGGYAKGAWGDEKTGSGRREVVAKMTSEKDTSMYGGSYSRTYTGDPDSKADDASDKIEAGLITKDGGIGGKGSAVIKRGDESHTANAQAVFGKKKSSANADYTHVDGKKSQQYKGSWAEEDGNGTVKLSTAHKHGEGGKKSSSGNLNLQYGDTQGASGAVNLAREDWKLAAEGKGLVTQTDDVHKTEIGGKASLTLLGDKPKSKKDDFKLGVSGGAVLNHAKDSAAYKGGVDADWGEGKASANVTHKTGKKGPSTQADVAANHSVELDADTKKSLNLGLDGSYTASNVQGEEDVWNANGSIGISKGEKKDLTSHTLKFGASKAPGADIIKGMGLPDTIPGTGYGTQFSLGSEHILGNNTFTTGANFGQVGDFNLGSASAGWTQKDGKKTTGSANLNFGMASNGTHSGFMGSGDFNYKPNDKWSFGAGGGFQSLSGPQGSKTTGFGFGEAGYNWSKDGGMKLKTGFASDGQTSTLYPELNVKANKDINASVLGAIPMNGGQASVGGKLNLPAGISVMAGYGDMGALSNPYQGNSGMTMPSAFDQANQMGHGDPMGGGGFVGVSADLIKTYRSIFKK